MCVLPESYSLLVQDVKNDRILKKLAPFREKFVLTLFWSCSTALGEEKLVTGRGGGSSHGY